MHHLRASAVVLRSVLDREPIPSSRRADRMHQLEAIIAERFRPGLEALVAAFNYAQDSQTDRWQFAIGLAELRESGATLTDLRWLVLRGFAEHALETTIPGDAERSFRKLTPIAFPGAACFVLSHAGASHLKEALYCSETTAAEVANVTDPIAACNRITPEWDALRRELRYEGKVIKRYRVPAHNQELILAAFQESGWPECIDDPMRPSVGQDSKERLLATIKSLNRNQRTHLIRFHGNGNGQQVYWQHVASGESAATRRHR
jgi:hypothetical protein